jgi:hypothetical protein
MDINVLDLECKYISGKPVYVDNVPIYPVSLDMMFDIGYSIYNKMLNMVCISSSQLETYLNTQITDDDIFDFIIDNSITNDEFATNVTLFFTITCRNQVKIDKHKRLITVILDDTKTANITSDNFLCIQQIIKQRNGIEDIDEEMDNPSNAMARQILEKRKKARQRLQRAKSKEQGTSNLSIVDLVSILASGLHLQIEQILNYDMYQFNNQFNRLRIFKDYEVNIRALLAGANGDDINLQHWISKINNE